MPTGVAESTRAAIWRLRSGPRAFLISAEVARHAMHQQYFGAPFDSKSFSKSGQVSRVTSRMLRDSKPVPSILPDTDLPVLTASSGSPLLRAGSSAFGRDFPKLYLSSNDRPAVFGLHSRCARVPCRARAAAVSLQTRLPAITGRCAARGCPVFVLPGHHRKDSKRPRDCRRRDIASPQAAPARRNRTLTVHSMCLDNSSLYAVVAFAAQPGSLLAA